VVAPLGKCGSRIRGFALYQWNGDCDLPQLWSAPSVRFTILNGANVIEARWPMKEMTGADSDVVDVAYKAMNGEVRVMPWTGRRSLAVADGRPWREFPGIWANVITRVCTGVLPRPSRWGTSHCWSCRGC
jgi:hypothetical protein